MKRKPSPPGSTARRTGTRPTHASGVAENSWGAAALLAAIVALYVARVLVPEDPGGRQGYGAPFVVLWLLAAGGWLLGQLRRGTLVVYAGWPDVAMFALVAWHTVSALVAFFSGTGAPRPALNVMWDWVAMGVAYLLARQVLRSPGPMRAATAVMIGLACGQSAMAVYQSFVTLPAARTAYDAIKDSTDELFQQTGQWMPPGSSVRQQFESRLESGLSTGTFALSNSLAGFVAPWLVVLGGILLEQIRGSSEPSPVRSLIGKGAMVAGALLVVLMMWCIVLTGSRSAGIAALAGLGVATIPLVRSAFWPRPRWRRAIVAILFAGAIGVTVVAATAPGRAALESAWRSMAFRMEYWEATAAMIADEPLWGCGPGQFQDAYTAYKLPTAAEEVQDPHNWLLEVWATAGTPAAIAIAALFVLVVWRTLRAGSLPPNEAALAARTIDDSATNRAALVGGVVGLALGTALAWWNNFALLKMQMLLLAAGIFGVGWLLGKWVNGGTLPARLPLVAAGALLLNLTVAGGIGFPNVADSLWLLVAIELNLAELARGEATGIAMSAGTRRTKVVGWAACAGLAVVLLCALKTEYLPVMGCRWRLRLADEALASNQVDLYRTSLDEATSADPYSSLAAERLAGLRLEDFERLPTAVQLRSFQEADARALALAPRRSGLWEKSGQSYAAIHQQTGDVEQFAAAATAFERAIELYPTNAEPRARLALLLAAARRGEEARTAAREAIALDDRMRTAGHTQQLLEPALRGEVDAIAGQAEQ